MLATVNSGPCASSPALQYLLLKTMKRSTAARPSIGSASFLRTRRIRRLLTVERFYRSGPPLLHQYMSFWLAVLPITIFIGLAAALIPILGFAPAIYRWPNRRLIKRWYQAPG
jgi:hypothetical protein